MPLPRSDRTIVLPDGGEQQITAEVAHCLEAAARGGGYICGPVTPLDDVPFGNLELLARAVKRLSPAYL